jgi:hypothetical protein
VEFRRPELLSMVHTRDWFSRKSASCTERIYVGGHIAFNDAIFKGIFKDAMAFIDRDSSL